MNIQAFEKRSPLSVKNGLNSLNARTRASHRAVWDDITKTYLETKVLFRNQGTKTLRGRLADKEGYVRLVFTHQRWDGMSETDAQAYADSVLMLLCKGVKDPQDGLTMAPIAAVHAERLGNLYGIIEDLFTSNAKVSKDAGDALNTRKSLLKTLFTEFKAVTAKQPGEGSAAMQSSLEDGVRELADGSLVPDAAACRKHLEGLQELVKVETIYSTKNCVVTTVLVHHTNLSKLHCKLMSFAGPIVACNSVQGKYASVLRQRAFYAESGCEN